MSYRLFAILLALCLLSDTALAGLGGNQVQTTANMALVALPSSGDPSSSGLQLEATGAQGSQQAPAAAYAQQMPPASQQKALQSFDVESNPPSAVYYNGCYLPWTSFTSTFPGNAPIFWIVTSNGWSWYAALPFGGWAQVLMYVPDSGALKVYEIYPTGITRVYNYGFASEGYNYIWFNGDVLGLHAMLFTINDQPSNAMMIDVSSMDAEES